MSLYKRKESPYWWSRFERNGKVFARSTKTESREKAEIIEREWKNQIPRTVNKKSRSVTWVTRALTVFVGQKLKYGWPLNMASAASVGNT